MKSSGAARAIVAAALASVLAACGGSAPSAEEPMAAGAMSPQGDVAGTLAEMDRAEADLAQALGDSPVGGANASSGMPAAPSAPAGDGDGAGASVTPSTPPRPVDVSPPKAEGKGKDDESGGCNIAKRALGSLQRAAEHLCGLTGEADPRCDTARGRAHRAAERVGASCPP